MKFFKTNNSEVYNRFLKINNNYNNIIKGQYKKRNWLFYSSANSLDIFVTEAWAAESRATGILNGEQET